VNDRIKEFQEKLKKRSEVNFLTAFLTIVINFVGYQATEPFAQQLGRSPGGGCSGYRYFIGLLPFLRQYSRNLILLHLTFIEMAFLLMLRLIPFSRLLVTLGMRWVEVSLLLGLVHGLELFPLLLSFLITQVLILAGDLASLELLNVVEVPGVFLIVLEVLLDLWLGFPIPLHKGIRGCRSELAGKFLGT
jgi:hypothetical protein